MTLFRIVLLALWLIVVYLTWQAVAAQGWGGANIFFDDFAHPWRAQINADFGVHLLLISAWVAWRERPLLALPCVLICLLGGSLLSLLYLLVATWRSGGDARRLVLGRHA